MKHLRTILLVASLAAAAIFWFGNRGSSSKPFPLSKTEIIASLGSMEGEIVEIIGGDLTNTYRWHGEMTLPYNLNGEDQDSGLAGTSRGNLSMRFPTAADHYHVIHVYDASDGGAMLVGRKVSLKPQTVSIR